MLIIEVQFQIETHRNTILRLVEAFKNASTHRSLVFRSGIAPRCPTLNIRRKRRYTLTTESLFLRTDRRQTYDALRSNAPCLLKLHCLSCPPAHAQRHQPQLLPNTSHLKHMRFLCSTLYYSV